MFGFKSKNKTSYPETFFVNSTPFLMTRCPGDEETYELACRLDSNRPYKGRYITPTRIELEEFKGIILKECYFSAHPGSWG